MCIRDRINTDHKNNKFLSEVKLEKNIYATEYLSEAIAPYLSLIHISEPTRLRRISYAVFCLKKKKKKRQKIKKEKYEQKMQ